MIRRSEQRIQDLFNKMHVNIQKKKERPEKTTQQGFADFDHASDGCVALFEHRKVRVCKSSHQ